MSQARGAPRFEQGRNHLSGNIFITGNTYMSGNLDISGSTRFGRNATHTHEYTGSYLSVSGNLYVQVPSYQYLRIGTPKTAPYNLGVGIGIANTPTHGSSSLYLYSNKANNSQTGSIILSAHANISTISESHPITEIGWVDNLDKYTPSWYITENQISSSERSTAEVLGNETDAAAAIGTIVGSALPYNTVGSKLFSVINGTGSAEREREYTDYSGNKTICQSSYTGSTQFKYWSELVALTGVYTDTVNTIEAGALCFGVSCRVVTNILTASYFHLGVSGTVGSSGTYKWGYGITPSASITNLTTSMGAGVEYYSTATPVRITPKIPGVGTGVATEGDLGTIRVEARYMLIIPPQI